MSSAPPDPHTVLGKTMLVLTAFTSRDRGVAFSELARRTGLPKATLHRTLQQLVDTGLLERSEERYRLGRLMFELGMRASAERDLLEVATPFLEELRASVGETVHLGVLDGFEVVYVAKLAGHRRVDAPSSAGGRLGSTAPRSARRYSRTPPRRCGAPCSPVASSAGHRAL